MRLDACRMIDLPKIVDPRGSLTFVEGGRHVPFEIRRVYYLYDVPGGAARAGHGHKTLEQLIVAVSGSFDVAVDDGGSKTSYHLNRADSGLYMPSMIWRQIDNFSTGSVCMVLASDYFDEADYYRDYDAFVRAARTAP
jgi:dTDP-4-dehydrorhamnose 3,5-epimerase-like enzyme